MIADKYIAPATGATINRIVETCVDEAEGECGWPFDKIQENDEIEKPQHYTFTKPAKDCWDVLFESELLTDHLVASAVQYLLRCKKKGMYEKDLKKAATYIKKALEMYAEKTKGN